MSTQWYQVTIRIKVDLGALKPLVDEFDGDVEGAVESVAMEKFDCGNVAAIVDSTLVGEAREVNA